MEDQPLTARQAADLLGLSQSAVYQIKSEIGYIAYGRAIRFEREDVLAYKARCRRGPQQHEDRLWDTRYQNERIEMRGSCEGQSTASAISALFEQKKRHGSTQ